MRFGFDLDEVVVNLTKEVELYIAANYGVDWPVECYTSYGFRECNFTNDKELNNTIAEDLISTIDSPDFQSRAKPVDNSVEVLQKLKKNGHKIFFVTNRPKRNQPATYKWLRKHKVPFDDLKFVGKNEEKGAWGLKLRLDMYVDDLYQHLLSMQRYKSRWRKGLLLFDRPWNMHYVDSTIYTRVKDWQEILRHIGVANR